MKKLYSITVLFVLIIYFTIEGVSLVLNKTIYKKKINVDFSTAYFEKIREKVKSINKKDLLNSNSTELYNEIINLKYYELSNLEIKQDFSKYYSNTFSYTPYREFISNKFESKNLNVNEYGFRGEKFSFKKKPDTFRILMVGSSALFGWPNSSDKETISYYLENELISNLKEKNEKKIQIEVLNLSVKSYNILQDYINYLIVSQFIEHDMVIIYNGHNDFNDGFFGSGVSYSNIIQKEGAFKIYYDAIKEKNYKIFFKQGFFYFSYKIKNYIKHLSKKIFRNTYELAKNIKSKKNNSQNRQSNSNGLNSNNTKISYAKILDNFLKLLNANKKKVIYIHQVNLFATEKKKSFWEDLWSNFGRNKNFYINFDMNRYQDLYLDQLNYANKVAKNNKTEFIDIEKKIKNLNEDVTVFFDHTHLTRVGNKFVALEISKKIIDKNYYLKN